MKDDDFRNAYKAALEKAGGHFTEANIVQASQTTLKAFSSSKAIRYCSRKYIADWTISRLEQHAGMYLLI